MSTEREARIALSLVAEPGSPEVMAPVAENGAIAAWRGMLAGSGPLAYQAARADVGAVLARAKRCGARFVMPGDEDWPAGLDDLAMAAPPGVLKLGGMPLGVWLRGPGSVAQFAERSVAIVGSRTSTPYGEGVAADLAAELAGGGVGVVSGAAYGIDSAAHRGALTAGGATMAVLACGVDVVYPRGNDTLLGTIAETQLVVSEVPPGSYPTRVRFLTRNRLIAAVSGATVIVEAAGRSGARNTANWAQSLSRPVMAVPGPITAATSVTPNHLIRTREAELVTGAPDILEMLGHAGEYLAPEPARAPERPVDRLGADELRVFEALPGSGGASASEVALRAGASLPAVLLTLDDLERAELAVQVTGGRWKMRPGAVG